MAALTQAQLAQLLQEITVGDRRAAVKAGATDNDDMTYFALHRRAVMLGSFDGDLDAFVDSVRVMDLKAAIEGMAAPLPEGGKAKA